MRIAVKDPVNGNSDSRFLTLKRGEPDYSLFHVPNDYRIVNETGAFSITYPVR